MKGGRLGIAIVLVRDLYNIFPRFRQGFARLGETCSLLSLLDLRHGRQHRSATV